MPRNEHHFAVRSPVLPILSNSTHPPATPATAEGKRSQGGGGLHSAADIPRSSTASVILWFFFATFGSNNVEIRGFPYKNRQCRSCLLVHPSAVEATAAAGEIILHNVCKIL